MPFSSFNLLKGAVLILNLTVEETLTLRESVIRDYFSFYDFSLRDCFYFEFYCWGNFNFKGICYKGLFFFHSLHICLCHGKSKGASRNFSETDISFHMILILAFSMKVTKLIKEIQKINMPKCVSTCFSSLTLIVNRVLLQKKM